MRIEASGRSSVPLQEPLELTWSAGFDNSRITRIVLEPIGGKSARTARTYSVAISQIEDTW